MTHNKSKFYFVSFTKVLHIFLQVINPATLGGSSEHLSVSHSSDGRPGTPTRQDKKPHIVPYIFCNFFK